MKPYSESCDQNREPILAVIKPLFKPLKQVLEVGSGTGQHAVYFARKMPHLQWYTSDLEENHEAIKAWLEEAGLANAHPPLSLDVKQTVWPNIKVDAVFSANTVHIMHWHEVEAFFSRLGTLLRSQGLFVLYGPFNYNHAYTSPSNAAFDKWLGNRDPGSGIRNFEDLNRLAGENGLWLKQDYAMPANNRILCWQAGKK